MSEGVLGWLGRRDAYLFWSVPVGSGLSLAQNFVESLTWESPLCGTLAFVPGEEALILKVCQLLGFTELWLKLSF